MPSCAGGSTFQMSDVPVAEAPETTDVDLLAGVDGFYERWSFEYSAPASNGILWVPDD